MLSETLIEHYDSVQRPWSQKAIDNEAFCHNVQFTREQKRILISRNQMAEPVNVILPAVDTAVSILTANNPRFQTTPIEGSDRRSSDVMNAVFDWVWSGQPYHDTQPQFARAIWEYVVRGRGVMVVYPDWEADAGAGEVRIESSDSLKWFPSPNTSDRFWRDAQHIIYADLMTPQQLVDRYGSQAFGVLTGARTAHLSRVPRTSFEFQDDAPPRSFLGAPALPQLTSDSIFSEGLPEPKYEILERYTKRRVMLHRVTDEEGLTREITDDEMVRWLEVPVLIIADGRSVRATSNGAEMQRLLSLARRRGSSAGSRDFSIAATNQNPEIFLRLTTRREMVGQGLLVARSFRGNRIQILVSVGGRRLFGRLLPISSYPVVPFQNRWNRNPYPESDVTFARPLQMELNKIHMQILAHAATSTGPLVLVSKGQESMTSIREQASRVGMKIVEVDMELGSPVIVQTQQLSTEFFALADSVRERLYELLGIWPFMQGNPSGLPANQPFRTTLVMQENAQVRLSGRLRDLQGGLRVLGHVVLEMIQTVYTKEKPLRLLQPNGIVEETIVNQLIYDDWTGVVSQINDVTAGRYDVQIKAGSTLPTNREAKEERNLQLFAMGLIDDVEALKHLEGIDVEGVLERKGVYAQQAQAIEQLEDLVKQLQGDLQTSQRELIHARIDALLAKFRENMNRTSNRFEQSQALYRARLSDEFTLAQQRLGGQNNAPGGAQTQQNNVRFAA